MIEEQGRVVAVEPGFVWVESQRQSTCSSCSANSGCGQGLMDKFGVGRRRALVHALSDLHLQVGDRVVLGLREDLLLRASLLVYLLPLLCLFALALSAQTLGLGEPLVIGAGLLGLAVGWLLVRWRSRTAALQAQMQPVVLRALLAAD